MSLLTETQISQELATVPGWTREGASITTVTERADFRDALLYLGAVAYLAETANHHPDVAINWNKVTLTLSTHSAGGLIRERLRPSTPDRRPVLSQRRRAAAGAGWLHAGSRRCSVTGTWPRSSARGTPNLAQLSDGVPVTNAAGNLTLIYLTGLKDDYEHDGRVVTEILSDPNRALAAPGVASLGACYKQLNSSVGQFGNFTLQASTAAVESSTAGRRRVQDGQRRADRARTGSGTRSRCGSRASSRRPRSADQPVFGAAGQTAACQGIIAAAGALAQHL